MRCKPIIRTLVAYGLLGAVASVLLSAGATRLWPKAPPKSGWLATMHYGPAGQAQGPFPTPAVTYSYVPPAKQIYADRFRLAVPVEPAWLGWTLHIVACGGVLLVVIRLPGIILAHRRRHRGRCAGCGYDVGGLSHREVCPECGRPISPRHES